MKRSDLYPQHIMLTMGKASLATLCLFALTGHTYAAETTSKGACFIITSVNEEPDENIYSAFNCNIEKSPSPHGTQVSLKILDPNKQITRVEILEAKKECDYNNPKQYNSCGSIALYNKQKKVTSVFSDMTVYADNAGNTENSKGVFTQRTPNISTCSRYISMQESVTVCYKPNAKSRHDVAEGFM
jgi:hypothetical protein